MSPLVSRQNPTSNSWGLGRNLSLARRQLHGVPSSYILTFLGRVLALSMGRGRMCSLIHCGTGQTHKGSSFIKFPAKIKVFRAPPTLTHHSGGWVLTHLLQVLPHCKMKSYLGKCGIHSVQAGLAEDPVPHVKYSQKASWLCSLVIPWKVGAGHLAVSKGCFGILYKYLRNLYMYGIMGTRIWGSTRAKQVRHSHLSGASLTSLL